MVGSGSGEPQGGPGKGSDCPRAADRERAASHADQHAAEADQSASDADQSGSDADRAAEERDEADAAADQAASDADQASADRLWAVAADEAGQAAHEAARAAREASTAHRAATRAERARTAGARTTTAGERDQTAAVRDETAARRDRRAEAIDAAIIDSDASLAEKLAKVRARAAVDRERAARDRERAARDRAEAARERARLEAELQSAHLDALTGALARQVGTVELANGVERARRGDGRFVIAFVDVDGMKHINDEQGHAAGDGVLRAVVAAMRAHLRSFDPIVRYGGDEFVCGLGGADLAVVERRFERIGRAIAHDAGVGISVGLAALAADEALESLTARADATLLELKHRYDA
jgi:diguanylate cyclase (GGDEF)-like protein